MIDVFPQVIEIVELPYNYGDKRSTGPWISVLGIQKPL